MLKPITTSVYTFSNLREGEFVYVDKTETIRELIRPKFAQYFCARPSRSAAPSTGTLATSVSG